MNNEKSIQSERLTELEELYKIAENSTENLDKIESESDRLRTRGTLALGIGYCCLTGGASAAYFLSENKQPQGIEIFPSLIAGLALLFGLFLCFIAFEFIKRRKSLRKERIVELDIQKKLFLLISEQMSRTFADDSMSPVTRATYEIRARRMWREDDLDIRHRQSRSQNPLDI